MKLILIFILFVSISYSNTIYVNDDAAGANNGLSWNDAYNSFQDGLDAATSGDQIWVAAGTYKPSFDYGLGGGSRFYHFKMINGVSIYGGFAGTESAVSERNDFGEGGANETILSGDLNGDDILNNLSSNKTDNVYHVFYHPNGTTLNSTAVLDGFTIMGGYANGAGDHVWGGGIFSFGCTITLNNLLITNNRSSALGGGIFNNSSSNFIDNCIIKYNRSNTMGGGIYSTNVSVSEVKNSVIQNNTSNLGGGVFEYSNAVTNFINCVFYNNTAGDGGAYGGWRINTSTFTNCTITENQANSGGGCWVRGNSNFNNSIVFDNNASNLGDEIYVYTGNIATLNHTIYSNDVNDIHLNGTGSIIATNNNITSDPQFIDVANDDYRISKDSPCIDAGNNTYNSETYDIRGEDYGRKLAKLTAQTGTIDMGAYEFRAGYDGIILVSSLGSVGPGGATINSSVKADLFLPLDEIGVVYSSSANPTVNDNKLVSTETNGSFGTQIAGLTPLTSYYARSFYTKDGTTEYSAQVSFTTGKYPISIDGNQDDIPDSTQNEVSTVYNSFTDNYLTVVSIKELQVSDIANKNSDDSQYSYPFGQIEFKITGSLDVVKVYYHGISDLTGYTYRKLYPDNSYKNFGNVVYSTEILDGNQVAVATLTLTDGGAGDYDGIVNGVIYDPGGPAIPNPNSSIPIWELWHLLVLGGALFFVIRRFS